MSHKSNALNVSPTANSSRADSSFRMIHSIEALFLRAIKDKSLGDDRFFSLFLNLRTDRVDLLFLDFLNALLTKKDKRFSFLWHDIRFSGKSILS